MKTFSDSLRSSELLSASELFNEGQKPAAYGPDYVRYLRRIVRTAARRGITYLPLVLYARISDPRPGQRETTSDQLAAARDEIKSLELEFGVTIEVIGEFAEPVSGWKWTKEERAEFVKAVKLATKHKAFLVAFDVSRFVRNEEFKSTKQEPTDEDFAKLMTLAGRAKVATIADPKIHEHRSRRVVQGIKKAKAAKNDAGPGHKKRRRGRIRSEVVELMDAGVGNREIGRQLDLPEPTVRRWRKRYYRYEGASFLKA